MVHISLIPLDEFQRIRSADIARDVQLELLADMCRANTLASVKRAGSGHLGSSFSSLDIVTLLYYAEMNTATVGVDDPNRDIYFSSKGQTKNSSGSEGLAARTVTRTLAHLAWKPTPAHSAWAFQRAKASRLRIECVAGAGAFS